MPIYEYRCSHCGHQQEFLQKLGDPPPTHCSRCDRESLSKMVTAAGFQLKGSGWYETDFKSGGSKPATKTEGGADSKEGNKEGGKESAKEGGKDNGQKGAKGVAGDGGKAAGQAGGSGANTAGT